MLSRRPRNRDGSSYSIGQMVKTFFPIEEENVSSDHGAPGEVASPTQPVPLKPKPYTRERLTEGMLTHRTPEAHAWVVRQFHFTYSNGPFVPLRVLVRRRWHFLRSMAGRNGEAQLSTPTQMSFTSIPMRSRGLEASIKTMHQPD